MHRVVFMGTPQFAVPSLEALHTHPEFDVVGVVTQPDRRAGRGRKVRQSEVKKAAKRLELDVFQPSSLRRDDAIEHIRGWFPDVIVVAAFGQILRSNVLRLPLNGCINVHASLLPRWRGAAPIQYAIRAGDATSGVTIMKMDEGLDTGPMLVSRAIELDPRETAGSLHDKLAQLGAEILPDALLAYLKGELTPSPQPEQGVTVAPTLKKEEGAIDWEQSAAQIDRTVRAFDPWPGTFTHFEGNLLKIKRGHPSESQSSSEAPGTFVDMGGQLGIQTGDGVYLIEELQPAGKRSMSAEAFLAGRQDAIGMRLGE